jgi:integrase
LRVRLPKSVVRRKEAIGKEEIREILLKCSNIKLKTYFMLLAATGMRATEALALRHRDFEIDDNDNNGQAFVRIRGEFTKTLTDRYVFLTKELVEQCKAWIDFKYRRRQSSSLSWLVSRWYFSFGSLVLIIYEQLFLFFFSRKKHRLFTHKNKSRKIRKQKRS